MSDDAPQAPSELTANIQLRHCPNCGQPVLPTNKFCPACGTSLSEDAATGVMPTADESGPLPAIDPETFGGIEPGEAVLMIRKGPAEGAKFELSQPKVSAGRADDSTIFLDDVTVSRRHAEFIRGDAGWTVTDVGSLNGTYVNRNRIESHRLVPGDEVQIGKYRFMFFEAPVR